MTIADDRLALSLVAGNAVMMVTGDLLDRESAHSERG